MSLLWAQQIRQVSGNPALGKHGWRRRKLKISSEIESFNLHLFPSDHLPRDWTVYQVPPSNGEKKQQIVKIISMKIISERQVCGVITTPRYQTSTTNHWTLCYPRPGTTSSTWDPTISLSSSRYPWQRFIYHLGVLLPNRWRWVELGFIREKLRVYKDKTSTSFKLAVLPKLSWLKLCKVESHCEK